MSNFDFGVVIEKAKQFGMALAEGELQTTKNLEDVSSEIHNIQSKNTLLHNQITTLCSAQVEEAQIALGLINSSQIVLKQVKKEFSGLKEKAKKGQEIIRRYSTIRQAFTTLNTLGKTREWIARLLHLKKEIGEIKTILKSQIEEFGEEEAEEEEEEEEEDEFADIDLSVYGFNDSGIDGDSHNILIVIYERLCGLEEFRMKVLEETSDNPAIKNVFMAYLSVIDSATRLFSKTIEKHFDNAVGLSSEEPEKLMQVVRIMERDEKKKTLVDADLNLGDDDEGVTMYSYKNFRQTYSDSLQRYIRNTLRYEVQNDENVDDITSKMYNLIEGEMENIERYMVSCFPSKYKIIETCIQYFDNEVRSILGEFIHEDADNITRAQILTWLGTYPSVYEIYHDDMETVKIDYSSMMMDLQSTINITFFNSLLEWREKLVNNLFNTIKKDASDEKGFLIQDDMLYTFGPIDFFSFLDQAFRSIAECGIIPLMQQVILNIRQTLSDYAATLLEGVKKHVDKITIKRLIALTNDCSKCILFTNDLQEQIIEALPSVKLSEITMEEVILGFTNLSKELMNLICNAFMSKTNPQLEKLFTKDWYVNKGERTCVTDALSLMQDDIQLPIDFMEWDNVVVIVTTVFNNFVQKYIDAFMSRKFLLTKDEREIIMAEVAASIEFLPPEEDNGWVSTIIKPLRIIVDVFETIDDEDLLQCMSEATSTFTDLGEIVFDTLIRKSGFSKETTELYLSTCSSFFKTKSKLNQGKNTKKSIFGAYNPADKQGEKVEKKPAEKKKKKKLLDKMFSSEAPQPATMSLAISGVDLDDDIVEKKETKKTETSNNAKEKVAKKDKVQEMNLMDFLGDDD